MLSSPEASGKAGPEETPALRPEYWKDSWERTFQAAETAGIAPAGVSQELERATRLAVNKVVSDVQHLSMLLLAIHVSSLEKIPIQVLCPFFNIFFGGLSLFCF